MTEPSSLERELAEERETSRVMLETIEYWQGHGCGGDCLAAPCTNCDGTGYVEGKGKRLERELAEAKDAISESVDRAEKAERRLAAVMPLFEEARDALVAIPLASAKLRGVRLDLGERMDDVGVPARWAAQEAERVRVANFQAALDEEIDP